MKTRKIVIVNGLIIALLSVMTTSSFGQKGYNMRPDSPRGECRMIETFPDLTDSQKEKIGEVKTSYYKNTNEIKKQLKVKQTELKNLQISDNVELQEINKKIEEAGAIKVNLQKEKAAMQFEIRNLLTEDQKVHFDAMHLRSPRKSQGCIYGQGYVQGKCMR